MNFKFHGHLRKEQVHHIGNGSRFDWLLKENCNVKTSRRHIKEHSECWRTLESVKQFELPSLKVESGNHQRRISLLQKFWKSSEIEASFIENDVTYDRSQLSNIKN